MKKVIIFSHDAVGILFVAHSDIMNADDEELGHLVKDHLERYFPHLLKNIDLENYELVTVIRLSDEEIKVEIMGDDGILYIQGDLRPVWFKVDNTKNEPLAVLAEVESDHTRTMREEVGLKSPAELSGPPLDMDNTMRSV